MGCPPPCRFCKERVEMQNITGLWLTSSHVDFFNADSLYEVLLISQHLEFLPLISIWMLQDSNPSVKCSHRNGSLASCLYASRLPLLSWVSQQYSHCVSNGSACQRITLHWFCNFAPAPQLCHLLIEWGHPRCFQQLLLVLNWVKLQLMRKWNSWAPLLISGRLASPPKVTFGVWQEMFPYNGKLHTFIKEEPTLNKHLLLFYHRYGNDNWKCPHQVCNHIASNSDPPEEFGTATKAADEAQASCSSLQYKWGNKQHSQFCYQYTLLSHCLTLVFCFRGRKSTEMLPQL